MFISFEGVDGSGKTTVIKKLKRKLRKTYNKDTFIYTKEPNYGSFGKKINKILLKNKELNPETELLLFNAIRKEHLSNLDYSKHIICDRFYDSTVAYQHYGEKVKLTKINNLHKNFCNNFLPDLTLFLDINPEISLQRKIRKNKYDELDINFHKNVYNGYLKIVEESSNRIVKIDANKNLKDVVNDCYNTIINFLI